jgi:hypothetical protein
MACGTRAAQHMPRSRDKTPHSQWLTPMTTLDTSRTPTPRRPRPFQFRLSSLLSVVALLCVIFAAFHWSVWLGILATLLVGLAVMAALQPRAPWGLGLLILVVVSVCLLIPASQGPQAPRRRVRAFCPNNLKHIALALQEYHDWHSSFPPPFIADKSGKPIHSWRVLILPFLSERNRYDDYRFDEPWNGPNNWKLADEVPNCFRCPDRTRSTSDLTTDYVAVVGPNTVWPADGATRLSDIIDGTGNTLLVVESAGCGIYWTEPRDLALDRMPLTINPSSGVGIASEHTGCARGVFVDGSIRSLPNSLPPASVKALLIRNDGQRVVLE